MARPVEKVIEPIEAEFDGIAKTMVTNPMVVGGVGDAPTITIMDTTIPIVEHKGSRVITLATMDNLHHRPSGTAGRTFREHRDKLTEGKHFFNVSYQEVRLNDEFRRSGIEPSPKGLILLTERGYSMLVKSFKDDLAWEVQDQLVDGYFDKGEQLTPAEFILKQAKIMVDHERKIEALRQKQVDTDLKIAETRQDIQRAEATADEAKETAHDAIVAAAAALQHKFGDPNYLTVKAFCSMHDITIGYSTAKVKGIEASNISRNTNAKVIRIPDELDGVVKSFKREILERVFHKELTENRKRERIDDP